MKAMKVEMHYDEKREMYLAVAPDLYFCTGLGKTPEEAHTRLELAVSLWFEAEGRRLHGSEGLERNPVVAPLAGSERSDA